MLKKILQKEHLKTYLAQITNRLLVQILSFLLGIFVVRIGGIALNGQYWATAGVINILFTVLASSVNTNYLRHGIKEDYTAAVSSTIAITLFSMPLIILSGFLFNYQIYILLLVLIQFSISSLFNLFTSLKRLEKKDTDILLPSTLPYLAALFLVFFYKPNNIYVLSGIMAISWGTVVYLIMKNFRLHLVSLNVVKNNLRQSAVLASSMVFTQVFCNADILFIKHYAGNTEAGLYRIASTFSSIITPFIGIAAFIYLSEIQTIIHSGNKNLFFKKFKQQIYIGVGLGLVFVTFSFLFNHLLIPLVYGQTSVGAVYTSLILSIGSLTYTLAVVISYTILGLKKDKYNIYLAAIAAIINLVANAVLIPKMGIIGGAVSNIITFSSICFMGSYYLYKWKVFSD